MRKKRVPYNMRSKTREGVDEEEHFTRIIGSLGLVTEQLGYSAPYLDPTSNRFLIVIISQNLEFHLRFWKKGFS